MNLLTVKSFDQKTNLTFFFFFNLREMKTHDTITINQFTGWICTIAVIVKKIILV